jgi:hypothetical protein
MQNLECRIVRRNAEINGSKMPWPEKNCCRGLISNGSVELYVAPKGAESWN